MLLRSSNFWLAVVFMGVSVLTWCTASAYDPMAARFPKLLAAVFALLSALLVFNTVTRKKAEEAGKPFQLGAYTAPAFVCLGIIGYALALDFAGFIIPSVLLMLFVAWVLGYRKAGILLAVSLGFVLAVYAIFGLLLDVPLPELWVME
ncbi:tripartite tricarboxylate transporter TctB family protein [Pseudodesulfovibrio tunisiensis]|uniref:tripartite tricarboxylate transporter TctB family protein n=1 Tax=Pseudodesulfovibrio tunisiensis TaxID=463192 RepID=UPI001FB1DAF2|nr:tripartite tricarboxylate transporter TctB family protein [Pseudodesulfovibrio tunisiensis]